MPDDIRIKRISAFIQKELSRIVSRELKDPVFDGKLISFSDISISRDLSTAHVNVSVFGQDDNIHVVVVALNTAEPYIRHEIMKVSDLRKVPTFTFYEDRTIENAVKIEGILDKLDIPPEDTGEEPE